MDPTQTTKLIASLVLFIITLLAGYLPVLAVTWAASRRRRRAINLNDTISLKQNQQISSSNNHNVTLKSLVPTSDTVPITSSTALETTTKNLSNVQRDHNNSRQPVDQTITSSQSNLLPSSSSSSATSIAIASSNLINTDTLGNGGGGGGGDDKQQVVTNNKLGKTIIEVKEANRQIVLSSSSYNDQQQQQSQDNGDYERGILNSKWVQASMFFGGGVLMATAFCHLIPETHDSFKAYLLGDTTSGHNHNHHHHHNHQQQQQQQQTYNNNSGQTINNINNDTTSTLLDELTSPSLASPILKNDLLPAESNLLESMVPNDKEVININSNLHDHHHNHDDNHNHNHQQQQQQQTSPLKANGQTNNSWQDQEPVDDRLNLPYIEISVCCGFFFIYIVEQLMVKFLDNHSHAPPEDKQQQSIDMGTNQLDTGSNKAHYINLESSQNQLTSSIESQLKEETSATTNKNELFKFLRGLIIVSAFSAHAIFDGVAIGSQTSIDQVWAIFIAIACHKLVIAAVVGLELYNATLQSKLWTIVHMTTFSSMSPIGILIVVIAQNSFEINVNHPIMILLQAFATGTIIYIVFVEILQPKGHDPHKHGFLKSFSLVLGFVFMLIVLTVLHDH